jgi:hypothetical protein
MSKRIRRLSLLAVILAACATTWPNTQCEPESPTIGTLLDAIERLVEVYKPDKADAIREAIFVCRKNAHSGSEPGGKLTEQKHCAFVVAAYHWALKKDFVECRGQLMHGNGLGTPTGPTIKYLETWPDLQCGVLTGRSMLDFIRVRLDGPGGLPDPNDPLRKKIIAYIDLCLANECPPRPLAVHCLQTLNAFNEATKPLPDWVYISNELDHMP